ncbi:MAG: hypothetical protein LBE86_07915 [Gemmobacter sp.]|nr:hypothetical protein [Gemmobacter sp.]
MAGSPCGGRRHGSIHLVSEPRLSFRRTLGAPTSGRLTFAIDDPDHEWGTRWIDSGWIGIFGADLTYRIFNLVKAGDWLRLDTLLLGKSDIFKLSDYNEVVHGFGGNDLMYGGDGSDKLFGGYGNDTLHGGRFLAFAFRRLGADTLRGRGELYGGSGADLLQGGGSGDDLRGDDGADRLVGGAGMDTLEGGRGRDILTGGAGIDILTGVAGADVFVLNRAGTAGRDIVTDFRSGVDRIHLDADMFDDLPYTGRLRAKDSRPGLRRGTPRTD